MITALTDPSQMPSPLDDQETFDTKWANVLDLLPERGRQENELAANMGVYAAGGAYAFPYVFDSSTADSDPGVGKLRLGSTTQNAANSMRMDLQAVGGADMTNVLADLRSVTSAVKGSIRVVKMTDPSKWLIFDVTAIALPTGYRNLTVNWRATGGGVASPFTNGDALLVFVERNGDSGTVPGATELLATMVVSSPVTALNFLNVFDADHDHYFVTVETLTFSASLQASVRFAVAGAVDSTANYATYQVGAAGSGGGTGAVFGTPKTQTNGVLEFSSVNGARPPALFYRGPYFNSGGANPYGMEVFGGFLAKTVAATGFNISVATGTITAGTIRVYGVRKV